jgi:hypothetical protein
MAVNISKTGSDTTISQVGIPYLSLGTFAVSAFAADSNYNAVTLAPGTYTLVIDGTLGCTSSGTQYLQDLYIGWTLLSSAYDRLFADGFSAIG